MSVHTDDRPVLTAKTMIVCAIVFLLMILSVKYLPPLVTSLSGPRHAVVSGPVPTRGDTAR